VKVYDRFTTVVFALPVFPLPRELAGIGAAFRQPEALSSELSALLEDTAVGGRSAS
jgi:hypothetical protein